MRGEVGDVLVVFAGYGETQAGAERMALRATQGLAARSRRVTALVTAAHPDTVAGLRTAGVPLFTDVGQLHRARPDFAPSVVHTFDLARPDAPVEAVRLARRYGARLVLTPCSSPQVWPDPVRAGEVCRAAEVVFALSAAEVAALRNVGVPATRIRRLPSASDLTGPVDTPGFRRRYGIHGPFVLFVGRRTVSKGYQTLLAAMDPVWRQLPDTRFVFVGPDVDPEVAGHLTARADPRLHDLGTVDEQTKHDALAACELLCLPSVADVFPLVFVEAWTCGKPVVSGAFAGAYEVVRQGVDGLVVPPGPAPLAAALIELLSDDVRRGQLGAAGRRRAERSFGWERVVDAYESGYASSPGLAPPPAPAR
ncbi:MULTISPECIES: glycosyltransferase family 4 protein [unclassified Micromonospora]|uniref:glycosyltransferase family 4 protein n=1 Tax=Micromonospora TaxID=1873 RepID=UPI0024903436|nr:MULTISPECIES: glycosyltransferase family 4 protein [unclassified Micromonospora]WKU07205.1 glycosyltransferase family 4 protein [Micromonospora sp. HUAS LYJ1]